MSEEEGGRTAERGKERPPTPDFASGLEGLRPGGRSGPSDLEGERKTMTNDKIQMPKEGQNPKSQWGGAFQPGEIALYGYMDARCWVSVVMGA